VLLSLKKGFFRKIFIFFHFDISTSNIRNKNNSNIITIYTHRVYNTLLKYYDLISYLLTCLTRTCTFPNGPKFGLFFPPLSLSTTNDGYLPYSLWLNRVLKALESIGRDFKNSISFRRYLGKTDFQPPQNLFSRLSSTTDPKFQNPCRNFLELLIGYPTVCLSSDMIYSSWCRRGGGIDFYHFFGLWKVMDNFVEIRRYDIKNISMERVILTLLKDMFVLCYVFILEVRDQLKSFFCKKLKFGSKKNLHF